MGYVVPASTGSDPIVGAFNGINTMQQRYNAVADLILAEERQEKSFSRFTSANFHNESDSVDLPSQQKQQQQQRDQTSGVLKSDAYSNGVPEHLGVDKEKELEQVVDSWSGELELLLHVAGAATVARSIPLKLNELYQQAVSIVSKSRVALGRSYTFQRDCNACCYTRVSLSNTPFLLIRFSLPF